MGCSDAFRSAGKSYAKSYSHAVVTRPCLGLSLGLLFVILLGVVGMLGYPLEIDSSGAAFRPKLSTVVEHEDAVVRSEEITKFNPATNSAAGVAEQQTQNEYSLVLYFLLRDRSGNIYSDANVDSMRISEQKIVNSPGYSDVCLRQAGTGACAPVASLLRYFYAEDNTGCGTFDPTGNGTTRFQPIDDTLLALIDPDATQIFCPSKETGCAATAECDVPSPGAINRFVDIDFGYPEGADTSTTTPNLQGFSTRLTFSFGLPLNGYTSKADRYDEQVSKIEDFIIGIEGTVEGLSTNDVEVLYISPILTERHFNEKIFGDVILVVLSIFLVFLYIWWHTKALMLAAIGVFQIVLSFAVGYLFMQLFLSSGPLSALNFLTLFIVLGIGADDIFILVDAWKQSTHFVTRGQMSEDEYYEKRMYYSFVRAFKAMIITSLTTAAAFFLNISSSIPAIATFGFASGMMVLLNFIFVISFFPCALCLWDRHFSKYACCFGLGSCISNIFSRCFGRQSEKEKLPTVSSDTKGDNDAGLRAQERYFKNVHVPTLARFKWPIFVLFLTLAIVCIGFATQLEDAEEPDQFVPSEDKIIRAFDLGRLEFAREEFVPQITVAFGLVGIDNNGLNRYNPNSIGTPIFAQPPLDLSPPATQELFIETCEQFRSEEFVLNGEVLCPMETFRDYVEAEGLTFPVPQADFLDLLKNFTADFEAQFGPAGLLNNEDADSREARRQAQASIYQTIGFLDSGDLAYFNIYINSTYPTQGIGSDYEPVLDHWDGVLRGLFDNATYQAAGLTDAIQTAPVYIVIETTRTLKQSVIVGISASLCLALVMIALLTQDFRLAALATISIGLSVASLIATIVWLGWSLGIIESVTLTIVVGLSVDYVLHLAGAYKESQKQGRYERARDALTIMGISVLSASITTFLAAIPLLLTYIIFFERFGIFIALVTVISTIYAFVFFVTALILVGHDERVNDLQRTWSLLCCKSQDDNKTGPAKVQEARGSVKHTSV